eukprot:1530479-Ditylum_brightwellii.AAC.1
MFLEGCVEARLNVVISRGAGSGKTTLLNTLSCFAPSDERIFTLENAAELQLCQEHNATLQSHLPNIEGHAEITICDLAMNTAHNGSMTIPANPFASNSTLQ